MNLMKVVNNQEHRITEVAVSEQMKGHRRHRLDIHPHHSADGEQGFKNANSSL